MANKASFVNASICKGSVISQEPPQIRESVLLSKRVDEIYENGIRYIGEKYEDKFHGFGRLTFPNGEIYIGEFKNN